MNSSVKKTKLSQHNGEKLNQHMFARSCHFVLLVMCSPKCVALESQKGAQWTAG